MAKRLGELLIEAQVISQEQLDQALAAQREDGRKLGHVLVEMKFVSEMQLTQALSRQLSVPWVSLYHITFSRSLLNFVAKEVAEKYSLVPIFVRKVRKQGDTLYVAMDDPTNEAALADVQKSAGVPVRPMIACPSDIRSAIRVYYGGAEPAIAAPAPPPPAPSVPRIVVAAAAPPPPKMAARRAPVDKKEVAAAPSAADEPAPAEEIERISAIPESEDHPNADPEIEATEIAPRPRKGPRMVGLTLLDGTTLMLPASKKKSPSRPEAEAEAEPEPERGISDQLTARDLISALRAVAHGADASEILGDRPPQWEALFATLLSLLLKKGLIADWEFIEEFRKI